MTVTIKKTNLDEQKSIPVGILVGMAKESFFLFKGKIWTEI